MTMSRFPHQDRLFASLLLGILTLTVATTACARATQQELPPIDESGVERGTLQPPPQLPQSPGVVIAGGTNVALHQTSLLRYQKGKVLEFRAEVPVGTVINVPDNYQISVLDYRDSGGEVVRSSTGFVKPVTIVSVPSGFAGQFPQAKIDELNATDGGLFITAAIIGEMEGVDGNFTVLKAAEPGEGFLQHYEASGRPKFNYVNAIKKRFGSRLNKMVKPSSQTASQRAKWEKIFKELKRAASRTVETPKSIIMVPEKVAWEDSIRFEKEGIVPHFGAWTIATRATAVRHDFERVPCAETMSEFVREAYQRAGYDFTVDFNAKKGNELIWSNSALVTNFSAALDLAGWVPWDTTVYKPVTGALLMNGAGTSPGHTYISAGDNGRFIVDNGAPQGRDLRKTSAKTIGIMYQTGVFFLPPGINPAKWSGN